jgi:hypothetical protein
MNGDHHTQHVLDVLGRTLMPFVGDTVAKTTGLMHCKRLGLNGDTLTPADLDKLLASVERGLTVFIGNQVATKAVARVRHALQTESAT